MNAPRLTDAQVSQALRAHLPDRAQTGLRERILEAAETTTQQRALPSFLGALSEADPVTRRRSLLIAAALLVALALAATAAVGAVRLLERDPFDDLSLEPPTDVPAFVLSSYERLPQLPPLALTWHAIGSDKGRVYVDRSGAVRFDRFTSVEATEPSSYTILRDHRVSGMAIFGSDMVWVEPGHEAIGDDPRVFLRTILNAAAGPGCEMERDPSAVGNGTAATGWRHVGVEYVAGRPTHHVACVGDLSVDIDLWLDIETRLILRTREPETDDAGQLIPGQFGTTEVTEITFGEQPAALFEAPEGVVHMTSEAYSAYLCTRDVRTEVEVGFGTRECAPPEQPEATPGAQLGGTYLLEDPFPVRLSMTVADGWTAVEERRFYHVGSLTRDDGSAGLRIVMVDTITTDACAKRAGAVDERATIDDLAAFLAGLPLIDISKNTDVTLDGYRGKYLEFTRTAGEIDCGWGGMDGWPASSPTASDEVDRVWILDVDGARLVIDAFSDPGASENVRAELRQIVESMQIEPSPTPTVRPSLGPRPSGPAGPLLWTQTSLKEDWPAPVRSEPAGGAIVVPLQENADEVIPDPLGDTGSAAHPWVDIRELQGGGARIIINLGSLPPLVAPIEQWIAYGVVVDDDRDGIPDRRFGIDNIPGTAPGTGEHRAWITDLHTGRTVVGDAGNYGAVGETRFDTWYPGEWDGARLGFGGSYAGGGGHPGLVAPFYVWASVIENGRVMATDYAPDVGWLLEAKP
jgi:hypothetical protein